MIRGKVGLLFILFFLILHLNLEDLNFVPVLSFSNLLLKKKKSFFIKKKIGQENVVN